MRMSGSGLGLFGLIIALLTYAGKRAAERGGPDPGDGEGSASLPPAAPPLFLPASSPVPWPAVIPPELPPCPGPGWVYDEPPPPEVQQRAGQLYGKLWAVPGKCIIEQTAGRWIAYRGEILRGGKKGVVAFRLRPRALPAAAAAAPAAARPPSVPPSVPPTAERSPGMPQPEGYVRSSFPTAAAAPIPASPLALRLLKYGMGLKPAAPLADVRVLQDKLRIASDGRFGRDTEKAVRTFQTRNGLTADGIVGPKTWTALFSVRS